MRTTRPVTARGATVVDREPAPGFSIGATFLGWAVASFFTLVLLGLVSALLGGALANDGAVDANEAANGGVTLAIGSAIAIFLAYLVGGYAAGRIALRNGMAHGAATVAWTVLFAVIAAFAGAALANYYAPVIPALDPDAVRTVTTGTLVSLGIAFLCALLGGALGGRLGERYHERHADAYGSRRRIDRGRTV